MSFKNIELIDKNHFQLESLEIGLTSSCNFSCQYCCAYQVDKPKYISADDVVDILDTLNGIKRIKLSGGEVLLYFDECLNIIKYCTSKNIATQINSNGSILNQEKLQRLENAGLDFLHISLNFSDKAEFKRFYRQPESVFHQIVENIHISAQSKHMQIIVESILNNQTVDTIIRTNHFIAGLDVQLHEIQNNIPVSGKSWDGSIPDDQVPAILENIIRYKHPETSLFFSCFYMDLTDEFIECVTTRYEKVHFPACIDGKKQLHLHCNGDILICELGYPVVIGNVFNGASLETIMNHSQELDDFNKHHLCIKRKQSRTLTKK